MSENCAFARHERRAVASHGLIGGDVFGMHALRFFDEISLDLRNWTYADTLKLFLHPLNRPEEIHCCGARLTDQIADRVEVALEIAGRFGFGVIDAKRDAHTRRYANRGRSTHHHIADHVGYLLIRLAGHINFFSRQLRLVDEANAFVSPFESLNHWDLVIESFSHLVNEK